MPEEGKSYQIVADTEISIGTGEITQEELQQLQGLDVLLRYETNNYQLTQMEFNTERLREIAFEYSILKDVSSSIEVDVMRVFRSHDEDRLTTSEISDEIQKPSSSVSRALSRLVEKGQISKVQRGVYSHP